MKFIRKWIVCDSKSKWWESTYPHRNQINQIRFPTTHTQNKEHLWLYIPKNINMLPHPAQTRHGVDFTALKVRNVVPTNFYLTKQTNRKQFKIPDFWIFTTQKPNKK